MKPASSCLCFSPAVQRAYSVQTHALFSMLFQTALGFVLATGISTGGKYVRVTWHPNDGGFYVRCIACHYQRVTQEVEQYTTIYRELT